MNTTAWKIIDAVDTRDRDQETGNKIVGSGASTQCECCGRMIDILVTVANGAMRKVVGMSCAKKLAGIAKQLKAFRVRRHDTRVDELLSAGLDRDHAQRLVDRLDNWLNVGRARGESLREELFCAKGDALARLSANEAIWCPASHAWKMAQIEAYA